MPQGVIWVGPNKNVNDPIQPKEKIGLGMFGSSSDQKVEMEFWPGFGSGLRHSNSTWICNLYKTYIFKWNKLVHVSVIFVLMHVF